MGLLDLVEKKLLELLNPIIAPIKGAINLVLKPLDAIKELVSLIEENASLIDDIITAVRTFRETPKWSSRVINGPKALEKAKRLAAIPGEITNAVKDLLKKFKEKLNAVESPKQALESDVEGIEELRGVVSKLGPKIAQAFEKAFGVFALVLDALVTVKESMADIKVILSDAKEILDDLNNLDGLFLQQKNPRRNVRTSEGVIRIRVGSLHLD